MSRIDYIDDPDAPAINSVVPSVVAIVRYDQGRVLMIHETDNDRWAPNAITDRPSWRSLVDEFGVAPAVRRGKWRAEVVRVALEGVVHICCGLAAVWARPVGTRTRATVVPYKPAL